MFRKQNDGSIRMLGPSFFSAPLMTIRQMLWTHSLMRSQYWARDKLNALATKRLRAISKHAYPLTYWHTLFRLAAVDPANVTLDQLERLPVTTKTIYQGQSSVRYIDKELLPQSYLEQSSGSTGKPFRHRHDYSYELRLCAVRERMYRLAGKSSRVPLIIVWARERRGFAFSNYYSVVTQDSDEDGMIATISDITSLYPDGIVLYGFASQLLRLSHACETRSLHFPVKKIIVGGEAVKEGQRISLAHTMAAEVRLSCGVSEVGAVAFGCEHNRLHVNEEWLFVEIVDPEGKRLPNGSLGRVVVTSFYNKAMPFIRYETGDLGALSSEACPCGRTLRTITVSGREQRFIQFRDGSSVSLLALSSCFDMYANTIRQYQIVRTDQYAFRIVVIPGPAFDRYKGALLQTLARRLPPETRIAFSTVQHIPLGHSGKAIYFIDESADKRPSSPV